MSDQDRKIVHLHTHTAHSALDGISKLPDLVAAAAADGSPALAITDHGTLAGTFNFAKAANKAGIKPILGIEAYLANGSRFEHNEVTVPADDAFDGTDDGDTAGTKKKRYEHLTMLAATPQGWSNLTRLAYAAEQTTWYKPRMDWNLIGSSSPDPATGKQVRHAEGIIVGTGCLGGPVAGPLLRGDLDTARANTARMVDLFGADGVFVEVMDHGIPAERKVIGDLVNIAKEFGLPVVATNDAHYIHASQAHAHDVWLCVGENQRTKAGQVVRFEDPKRFRFNGEGYHLRTADEMYALFGNQPGTEDAVANSLLIAERIHDNVLGDFHTRLPKYPLPAGYDTPGQYLHALVRDGAIARYGIERDGKITIPADVRARLRFEEDTIISMGYPEYFLIVWDAINWARSDRGLPNPSFPEGEPGRKQPILVGPGRGSAAGSVTLYALGITNVEPLSNGLLFERFLDPSRDDLPDVDTDIQKSRREEVIQYLRARFGEDHVARIGTWSAAWAKRAIKDVARVTDRTPLANIVTPTIHIQGKPEDTPISLMLDPSRLKPDQDDMGVDLRNIVTVNPDAADLVNLAAQVEGVISGESIHACGIVIGDDPLPGLIPLRADTRKDAAPDELITSWDSHGVADAGLVKFDWLFLRDLDVIDTCARMVAQDTGEQLDLYNLPTDTADERVFKTWQLLSEGRTAGVFQLASSGITDLTQKVGPISKADLSSILALYRPGPMSAGMHERFILRRNGTEPVDYDFYTSIPEEQAVIEEVLGGTLGIICYQEQLMSLGRLVADFQPNQTNRLRKAFSKKNQAEMDAVQAMWVEGGMSTTRLDGTTKLAFTRETLDRLWVTFNGSAKYLFNACVTGDTIVTVGRGTGTSKTTVAELYGRLHGLTEPVEAGMCRFCGKSAAGPEDRNGGRCRGCAIWLTKFRSCSPTRLLAYDANRKRLKFEAFADVHRNGVKQVFELVMSDGRTVRATGNHRFRDRFGFRRVDELQAGDTLLVQRCEPGKVSQRSRVSDAQIVSITPAGQEVTYDVEMAEGTTHTFLANGIVSHNSHSAGYAEITYATAFLKANYPAHYGASLLSHVKPTDREKRSAMLASLRADGVTVLGPSVNDGKATTSVDANGAVRIGMSEVIGGGAHAIHIERARAAGGPFTSLADLAERVGIPGENPYVTSKLPSPVIEALIEAGALDDLGPRLGLRMALGAREVPDVEVPNAEWGALERSLRERQRLGVLLSPHPMLTLGDQVRNWAEDGPRKAPLTKVADIPDVQGATVSIVGCVATVEVKTIKSGQLVKAVIDDETGSIPVIFWPKTVRENADAMADLVQGRIVGVTGVTRVEEIFRSKDESDDADGGAEDEVETQTELAGFRLFTGDLSDPDVTIHGRTPAMLRRAVVPATTAKSPAMERVIPDVSVQSVVFDQQQTGAEARPALGAVPTTDQAAGDMKTVVWYLEASTPGDDGESNSWLRDRLMERATMHDKRRFPDLFRKSPIVSKIEAWWQENGSSPGSRTPEDLWVPSARDEGLRLVIEVSGQTALVDVAS